MYPQSMYEKNYNLSSKNYLFYSHEKLQYITWACFRNVKVNSLENKYTQIIITLHHIDVTEPCRSLCNLFNKIVFSAINIVGRKHEDKLQKALIKLINMPELNLECSENLIWNRYERWQSDVHRIQERYDKMPILTAVNIDNF